MGQRSIQQTITVPENTCDACGKVHADSDEVAVIGWDVSPRIVTEDPGTKRPVVVEAVPGDPLVLCRARCVRKVAALLRAR